MMKNQRYMYLFIIFEVSIAFPLLVFLDLRSHLNVASLSYFNLEISKFILTSFLIFMVLWLFVELIIKLFKLSNYKIFDPLIIFTLIFVNVSFFYFSNSFISGIQDSETFQINKLNFFLNLLISIIFVYLYKKILDKKKILLFFFYFLIFNFALFGYEFYSYNFLSNPSKTFKVNTENTTNNFQNIEKISLSNKHNLIVLSFGGLSSHVYKTLLEDKKYSIIFKDFIFKNNTFSQAPATFLSIAGEIYGNKKFSKIGKNEQQLQIKLTNKKNIFDNLSNLRTFGAYNIFNNKKNSKLNLSYLNKESTGIVESFSDFAQISNIHRLSFSKIGTRYISEYIKFLELKMYKFILKNKNSKLSFEEKVFFSNTPYFDKSLSKEINNFKSLVDNIVYEDINNKELFLHFEFTHFPVNFGKDCDYKSYEQHEKIQNYKGVFDEHICTLKLINSFLNKLKSIGVYENSTIIIKGDHSKPSYYFSKEGYPRNLLINNHKQFGYERYRPVILIKKPNVVKNEITYDEKIFSTNFLNYIYCSYIENIDKLDKFCNEINKQTPEDFIQIYIPKNKRSSYDISDLKKVEIYSKQDFIQKIENLK